MNDLLLLPPTSERAGEAEQGVPGSVPPTSHVGHDRATNLDTSHEGNSGAFPLPTFELVVDHEHAARVCEQLAGEPVIAIDIETAPTEAARLMDDSPGLDPFRNQIRLVQLAGAEDHAYLFDLRALRDVPQALRGLLVQRTTEFVGFNIAFEAKNLLHHYGIELARPVDLYAAAILVEGYGGSHAHEKGYFSLASVARRYLGVRLDKEQQLSDWSIPTLTEQQLVYAALDAVVLLPLFDELMEAVAAAGVSRALDLENGVIIPLAAIERTGIRVDRGRVKKLTKAWNKAAFRAGAKVLATLGEIDIDSPDQIRRAFRLRLGLDLPATDETTLNELAEDIPIVSDLLEYRRRNRRSVTYGQAWLEAIEQDGRIHAAFHSLRAPTGRMSCSAPNIQAVPRDPIARACFVPSPGYLFLIADYHAIELRVIAQLIGDPELRSCFCSVPAIDPHTRTASLVLGKPIADVSKEERGRAKAINFGFAFSLGAENFVSYARNEYGVAFTLREAVILRQAFFGRYSGIAAWHRRARFEGQRRMQVRTASGRLRVFSEFRLAEYLNTPIQGTAADGMKRALALLHPQLASLEACIVNVIHDELVVEVPAGRIEEAKVVVDDAMVAGMKEFLPDIPVVVETVVSPSWSKTKQAPKRRRAHGA